MSKKSKAEAMKALSQGAQYLDCILTDSRIWLDLVKGDGLTKRDAVTFLINRIHSELHD
jgi:hypothetical protein